LLNSNYLEYLSKVTDLSIFSFPHKVIKMYLCRKQGYE
jgi:hypothetical protein